MVNSDLFRNKNYSTFAQIKNKIVFVQLIITFSSYNCLYFSLIFKDVIIRILWNQYVLVMVGLQDCYLFLLLNILGYVLGSCCHLFNVLYSNSLRENLVIFCIGLPGNQNSYVTQSNTWLSLVSISSQQRPGWWGHEVQSMLTSYPIIIMSSSGTYG